MSSSHFDLLQTVPDFTNWEKALSWIDEQHQLVRSFSNLTTDAFYSLEWKQISSPSSSFFGLYSLENWRKFVLSVYFADLVSYSNPVDQVNFDRLLFVMHAFPQGFRVWWAQISNHWIPVGYSGWYPMLETTFADFEKQPQRLQDRTVIPDISPGKHPILYLFNFSASPQLKGSTLTKHLMKSLASDIENTNYGGLACITVSEDGVRAAKRFGMHHTGNFSIDGSLERVHVKRLDKTN